MEDSFSVRVGKIFGSLAGSSSSPSPASGPPSSLNSLWSLTDEEIERREWNREKGSPEAEQEFEPQPYNSKSKLKGDFSNELEKDLLDLDDDDHHVEEEDEEGEEQQEACGSSSSSQSGVNKHKPVDYNDEEWEIKSSIGLDCTLDYEEEEDGYDKVAVGNENPGDRLYMRDVIVNDYGIDIDSQEEVPTSFKDFTRDPRANHLAAKIRLQRDAEAAAQIRLHEDAEAVQKIDSLRVSGNDAPHALDAEIITSEDSINLKSILKRKNDNQFDSAKSQKRVRFDPDCKSNGNEECEGAKDIPVESHSNEDHRVPDYIRNPSRYTHYTFDSTSDVDDESNRQAYVDFLNLLRKSNSMEPQAEDAPVDLSKRLPFTPKKKSTDAVMQENDGELEKLGGAHKEFASSSKGVPLAIAVEDNEGVCAMDEDEPDTAIDRRTGRQYRSKPRLEMDE